MRKAIVTAADTSHALSVARLVKLCKEQMPEFKVYVFDLGLTEADLVGIDKKAIIIKYDYAKYPAFHNININAGEYAWKPICIHEIAKRSENLTNIDLLFWIDAGCLIKNGLKEEIEIAKKWGIYTSLTKGTLGEYTDPRTLNLMGVPDGLRTFRMRAASLIGFYLNNQMVCDLTDEWSRYALQKNVFAPDGSSKHPKIKGDKNPQFNHRQDQSVFNALLAQYGFNKAGQRWNFKIQQDIDNRPKNIK